MNQSNTAISVLPTLGYSYQEVISKDYGKVFLLSEQKTMICELTREYVPIEEFREIFALTVPFIKEHGIRKFVFDKQNLRVFHQPSMEWYFITWKKEILAHGLRIHRKILPKDQPAFALAVEAGRAKIRAQFPDHVIDELDIQYKNSVREAIEE